MQQFSFLCFCWLSICGMFVNNTAWAGNNETLQSFYVFTEFSSDAMNTNYTEILDVSPRGTDVGIRVIRISSEEDICGGSPLLRAKEQVLPNTTILNVAGGVDLCSYTEQEVTTAIEKASHKHYKLSYYTHLWRNITTNCGTQKRVFHFPVVSEAINLEKLRRKNPRLMAMFDSIDKIYISAFGKKSLFSDLSKEQENECENLGTKLFPELISGKYGADFTEFWKVRLRKYVGPPGKQKPEFLELFKASSLPLGKYELPRIPESFQYHLYPHEVVVKVLLDGQTGLVKQVFPISGPDILCNAAKQTVSKWQFAPTPQSDQPIEIELLFSIRCPNR
jgi:hypothetical protein